MTKRTAAATTTAAAALQSTGATSEARQTTYREALREAHRDALTRDPRVFLMGEDVGRYGGCFAVSLGCWRSSGQRGSATPPCPSRGSPAPGSGPPWAGCARLSRS